MSKDILLSIYIPTFNRPKELLELLKKIKFERSKLVDPFVIEVVVSDNCSDFNICDLIKENDLADKYTKNDINLGADENVLMYQKKTKGEFIWLIGDDDLIVEDALLKIIKLLNKIRNESCDLVYLNSQIEDMNGNLINKLTIKNNYNGMMKSYELVDKVNVFLLTMSCLIVRRMEDNKYFENLYGKTFYVSPLAIALDRLISKPNSYFFNFSIVRYREGDKSGWNKHWSMISLIYVPYILNEYIILSQEKILFDPFLFNKERNFEFIKLFFKLDNYNQKIFRNAIKQYMIRKNIFLIILKSLPFVFYKVLKKITSKKA